MELQEVIIGKIRAWVRFVGPSRLIAGCIACVVTASVGVWMLVPSGPPVELSVPTVAPGATVGSSPTGDSDVQAVIRVHVAGAVKRPGVYEVRGGARVVDAVTAAGGPVAGADLDAINMAQTVKDAEQVYVPRIAPRTGVRRPEPRLRPRRVSVVTTVPSAPASQQGSTAGPVNLNSATAAQLDALPGVGPATARAIITYRSSKGPFARVEDLLNVPGIGPAKLDAMRGMVTV